MSAPATSLSFADHALRALDATRPDTAETPAPALAPSPAPASAPPPEPLVPVPLPGRGVIRVPARRAAGIRERLGIPSDEFLRDAKAQRRMQEALPEPLRPVVAGLQSTGGHVFSTVGSGVDALAGTDIGGWAHRKQAAHDFGERAAGQGTAGRIVKGAVSMAGDLLLTRRFLPEGAAARYAAPWIFAAQSAAGTYQAARNDWNGGAGVSRGRALAAGALSAAVMGGVSNLSSALGAGGWQDVLFGGAKGTEVTATGVRELLKRSGIAALQSLPEAEIIALADMGNRALLDPTARLTAREVATSLLENAATVALVSAVGAAGRNLASRDATGQTPADWARSLEPFARDLAESQGISYRRAFDALKGAARAAGPVDPANPQSGGAFLQALANHLAPEIAAKNPAAADALYRGNAAAMDALIDGNGSRSSFRKAGLDGLDGATRRAFVEAMKAARLRVTPETSASTPGESALARRPGEAPSSGGETPFGAPPALPPGAPGEPPAPPLTPRQAAALAERYKAPKIGRAGVTRKDDAAPPPAPAAPESTGGTPVDPRVHGEQPDGLSARQARALRDRHLDEWFKREVEDPAPDAETDAGDDSRTPLERWMDTSADIEYNRRFGHVISGDNARALLGADPARPESHAAYSGDVARIVEAQFGRALDRIREKGGGVVVFTGGGNGAGKSTAIADHKGADAVFDSTMTNEEATAKNIQAVIDAGGKPVLVFVHRDPLEAWQGIEGRKAAGGHGVTEASFANSHAKARETFLSLVERFGDKVRVVAYENAGGETRRIPLDELAEKPAYTKEQIHDLVQNHERRSRNETVHGEPRRAHLEEPQRGAGESTTAGQGESHAPGGQVAPAEPEQPDLPVNPNPAPISFAPAKAAPAPSGAEATTPPSASTTGAILPQGPSGPVESKIGRRGVTRKAKRTTTGADPKRAAKVVENFVAGKNESREILKSPYHDHTQKRVVASDGAILISTRHGYDPAVNLPQGQTYLQWKNIVDDARVKNTNTQAVDPGALAASAKTVLRLARAIQGANASAVVQIPLGDGIALVKARYLQALAEAMQANGIDALRYRDGDSPLLAENADTSIVAMPLRKESYSSSYASTSSFFLDAATGRLVSAPEDVGKEARAKDIDGLLLQQKEHGGFLPPSAKRLLDRIQKQQAAWDETAALLTPEKAPKSPAPPTSAPASGAAPAKAQSAESTPTPPAAPATPTTSGWTGRADYQERRNARISGLRNSADAHRQAAKDAYERAQKATEGLPFGQPNVGGRLTPMLNRYKSGMNRSMKENEKAKDAEERAQIAESNTVISSDDPEALVKLRQKLASLEKRQALMKAVNAALRMKDTAKGDAKLRELGCSDDTIHKMRTPDPDHPWDSGGFPPFELSNNNANIKRVKERIAELEKRASGPAPESWAAVKDNALVHIVPNVEQNRLQITHAVKPSSEEIERLKSHGFRWSPREKAWQRKLTDAALRDAKRLYPKDDDGDVDYDNLSFESPAEYDAGRRLPAVRTQNAVAVPVKGTKVSDSVRTVVDSAFKNLAAQPNYAHEESGDRHCLVLDGQRWQVSKSGLRHGADRRFRENALAAASIGDLLNASVETTPPGSAPWRYRVARLDAPDGSRYVLTTFRDEGSGALMQNIAVMKSLNTKKGAAAQGFIPTNGADSSGNPDGATVAELRDAFNTLFRPGLEKHVSGKPSSATAEGDRAYSMEAVETQRGETETPSTSRSPASNDVSPSPLASEKLAHYFGDVNQTQPRFLGADAPDFSVESLAGRIRESLASASPPSATSRAPTTLAVRETSAATDFKAYSRALSAPIGFSNGKTAPPKTLLSRLARAMEKSPYADHLLESERAKILRPANGMSVAGLEAHLAEYAMSHALGQRPWSLRAVRDYLARTYGLTVGDATLRRIAASLSARFPSRFHARLAQGLDEFEPLTPKTDAQTARALRALGAPVTPETVRELQQAAFHWDASGATPPEALRLAPVPKIGRRGATRAPATPAAAFSPAVRAGAYRAATDAAYAQAHPEHWEAARRMLDEGLPVSDILEDLYEGQKMHWPVTGLRVDGPEDIAAACSLVRNPFQESMKVVYLDENGTILAARVVSLGTVNASMGHPRDLFADVPAGAVSVVLAHNHPSGDPTPSQADVAVSLASSEAARLLGLHVADHVVTDTTHYHSMRERGTFDFGEPPASRKRSRRRPDEGAPRVIDALPDWRDKMPYEAVDPYTERRRLWSPEQIHEAARLLQTHDRDASWVFALDQKNKVLGIAKVGASGCLTAPELARAVSSVRGAAGFILGLGGKSRAMPLSVLDAARVMRVPALDAIDLENGLSWRRNALAPFDDGTGKGSLTPYDPDAYRGYMRSLGVREATVPWQPGMRSYIEERGGKVVSVQGLAAAQFSATLSPSPENLAALRARFGSEGESLLHEYGIASRFDALTNSQAREILKFKDVDALRARFLEEGHGGKSGVLPAVLESASPPVAREDAAPYDAGAPRKRRPAVSRGQIVDLARSLWPDIPIVAKGSERSLKSGATWSRPLSTVRLARMGDVESLSGALGEMLYDARGLSKALPGRALAELDRVATAEDPLLATDAARRAAFGGFLHDWLCGADTSDRPAVHAAFENWLDARPDEAPRLFALHEAYAAFRLADPDEAIRAAIGRGASIGSVVTPRALPAYLRWQADRARQWAKKHGRRHEAQWVDRNRYLLDIIDDAGIDLAPHTAKTPQEAARRIRDNPFVLASYFDGRTNSYAEQCFMNRVPTTLVGGEVPADGADGGRPGIGRILLALHGKGEDGRALSPRDFITYAAARRGLSRYFPEGRELPFSREQAEAAVARHQCPEYDKALQQFTDYAHNLLGFLEESGAITADERAAIEKANPVYLPMMRVFSEAAPSETGRGASRSATGSGLHGLSATGSLRDIRDPLVSLVEQTRQIIGTAQRAAVVKALVRLYDRELAYPGEKTRLDKLMREVDAPVAVSTVTGGEIAAEALRLAKESGDRHQISAANRFANAFWGERLRVFRTGSATRPGQRLVRVCVDGKPRWFEIDSPQLWERIAPKEKPDTPAQDAKDTAAAVVDTILAATRMGATVLNPSFNLVLNPIRDTFTALLLGQYATPGDLLANLRAALWTANHDAEARLFADTGMEYTLASYGSDRAARRLAAAAERRTALGRATQGGVIRAAADLLSTPERGPRIREGLAARHLWLRRTGGDADAAQLLAGCAMQDVTGYFKRGGSVSRAVSRFFTLFFNANVQSLDKLARSLALKRAMPWERYQSGAARAGNTAARMALFGAGSALLCHWIRAAFSSDEQKKRYDELPAWEKAQFLHIPAPNGIDLVRIPQAFEAGALSQGVASALLDYAAGDKRALSRALDGILAQGPVSVDLSDDSRRAAQTLLRNITIAAPFVDVLAERNWYGAPIAPKSLVTGKPKSEWRDEKTTGAATALARTWNRLPLPEASPIGVQYVLDNFAGGLLGQAGEYAADLRHPSRMGAGGDWSTLPVVGRAFVPRARNRLESDFHARVQTLDAKVQSGKATLAELGELSLMAEARGELHQWYGKKAEARLSAMDETLSPADFAKELHDVDRNVRAILRKHDEALGKADLRQAGLDAALRTIGANATGEARLAATARTLRDGGVDLDAALREVPAHLKRTGRKGRNPATLRKRIRAAYAALEKTAPVTK